jgi:hypothetical protein
MDLQQFFSALKLVSLLTRLFAHTKDAQLLTKVPKKLCIAHAMAQNLILLRRARLFKVQHVIHYQQ